MIGPRVRTRYAACSARSRAPARAGWSPDTITHAQLVAAARGWAFAVGAIFLAGWLAGTLDILDGGLARRRGVAGPRGALVDSVVDRWAEFATFVGLGAFFRESWMLAVVAFAAFGSQMVSYTRARAEGLGLDLTSGRAQRPERYVVLGCGAWLSSLVAHLVSAGRAAVARGAEDGRARPRGPVDGPGAAAARRAAALPRSDG
jgi:phosphatidylglycerophosphate synthase